MRKLVSICLLIALICSLCATGVSSFALSEEELLEKYGPLIDALEAGDVDSATNEFFALLPSEEDEPDDSENAEAETIELTVDNFYDYYELCYVPGTDFSRDSKGNITSIWPGQYEFVLKDEYRDRYSYDNFENNGITLGIVAKESSIYRAKIDWETGEVKHGDKVSKSVRKDIRKDCKYSVAKIDKQITGYDSFYVCQANFFYLYKSSGFKWWSNGWPEAGDNNKYYIDTWKVEVVNVSGTLILDPAS